MQLIKIVLKIVKIWKEHKITEIPFSYQRETKNHSIQK